MDEISDYEKIEEIAHRLRKAILDFGVAAAAAVKPLAEALSQFNFLYSNVPGFKEHCERLIKKERNRKRYYRMMENKKRKGR